MSLSQTSPQDGPVGELAQRIRDRTRQLHDLRAARDLDLVAGHEAGLSYAELGRLIGFTHRGAKLVIDRTRAESRNADVA